MKEELNSTLMEEKQKLKNVVIWESTLWSYNYTFF